MKNRKSRSKESLDSEVSLQVDEQNTSLNTSKTDIMNQSTSKSTLSQSQKKPKIVYKLRRTIFRIFIFFSALVMIASTIYTVYGLLWVKLFQWTKEAVEASSLLNVDILTQVGALNAQDQLVISIRDLKISQEFV